MSLPRILLSTLAALLAASAWGAAPLSGIFHAAADGMAYCGDQGSAGMTRADGRFGYLEGETLAFRIGNLELGRAKGAAVVTAADFADGKLGPQARLALRVLYSLDDDYDPGNGITIPPSTRAALVQSLALAAGGEAEALAAVRQARPNLAALVSDEQALGHFAQTLVDRGILLNPPEPAPGQAGQLTLLHSNDTHSHIETFLDGIPQGGVARRKTLVDQARAAAVGRDLLLLDAGDFSQGSPYYNAWEGSESIMAMNAMGYDASALGNHEFDLGPAQLARALKGEPVSIAGRTYATEPARFPLLATNLDISGEPALRGLLHKFAILEKGGSRYGVLGVTTEELPVISNLGDKVKVLDSATSVNAAAALLKALGIDRIILLSHSGHQVDADMAKHLAGVDLIVSGHDHALLGDRAMIDAASGQGRYSVGPYPIETRDRDGNKLLVVSDYEWGRWLGRLEVSFDARGQVVAGSNNSMFVDGRSVPEDAGLQDKVAAYKAPVEAFSSVLVGRSGMVFSSARGTASPWTAGLRSGETPLGNLVSDLMEDAARSSDRAVAAFSNGGGLRAGLEAGDVTFGQALSVLPSGGTLFVLDLTGREVIDLLETSVARVGGGGFLQLSRNLRMAYCADVARCEKPLKPGGRVTRVSIAGQPLDPEQTYRLASNNFTAGGGDGYTVLAQACKRPGNTCRDTGVLLLDLLVARLKTGVPLTAQVEGRIERQ